MMPETRTPTFRLAKPFPFAAYPGWLSLKCAPEYALELREHHSGIEGAYHFNKKYWNQVSLQGDIDDKLILSLIDHSYEEVIKKFTRKLKKEYDEIP